MRRGYSKALTVILIMIIVAVIGLLAYLGFDYYSKYRTNKDGEAFVDTLTDGITVDAPEANDNTINANSTENIITTQTETNSVDTTSGGTTVKRRPMYKGFYTLGSIEIPKTNVKYPILEKVTKKSLETAVAVVWPENATLNKPGNVVIVGHNYRNGVFFSNNKKLSSIKTYIYIKDFIKVNKIQFEIVKIKQKFINLMQQ